MILKFDPFGPDNHKQQMYAIGVQLITDFLKLNNLYVPSVRIDNTLGSGYNGYYDPNTPEIVINLKNNRVAVKNPQWQWSFPGYKADLTPIGVLTHETGHHVHYEKGVKECIKLWKKQIIKEPAITQYDRGNNTGECIAESIKLFITNPDLLKVGRPKRYKFLTEELGLKPLHDEPWQEVLKFADKKFIPAATNWAGIKE